LNSIRVRLDFLGRQRGPGRILAGRIADHPGEIADQEYHIVTELLELAHLVDENRVTDMQVGRGGIEAGLYDQRPALFQFRFEPVLGQYFICAAGEFRDLFLDAAHDLFCGGAAVTAMRRTVAFSGSFDLKNTRR
jgi:hypothetical protein